MTKKKKLRQWRPTFWHRLPLSPWAAATSLFLPFLSVKMEKITIAWVLQGRGAVCEVEGWYGDGHDRNRDTLRGIKGNGEGLVLQHGVTGSRVDMEGNGEHEELVFLVHGWDWLMMRERYICVYIYVCVYICVCIFWFLFCCFWGKTYLPGLLLAYLSACIVFFFSFCFVNTRFIISRKFKCIFSFTLFRTLFPIYDFLCH